MIAGQKGLTLERDLRIPNMRNLMAARTKAITVVAPEEVSTTTEIVSYEKLPPKQAVKMVDANNLEELIDLLHNEAKVI